MALNADQETINQITETVTNNVLEAVEKRFDEILAEQDQTKQEDTSQAKETIKRVIR